MRRASVPLLVCLIAHLALPAVALTAAASPSNDVARLTGPLANLQASFLPPRTGGDLFGRAAPDGPRPLPLASALAAPAQPLPIASHAPAGPSVDRLRRWQQRALRRAGSDPPG